jgi:dCMP deaminase
MTKWDRRFFNLAREIASWSKDPSTKCGAVIAKGNVMISSGYNGFPAGTSDDEDIYNDRERKYARVIHAELNAILYARENLEDATIYVYPFPPCSQCAAAIIQSKIKRVVTREPSEDLKLRWGVSLREAALMFAEAGIIVDHIVEN